MIRDEKLGIYSVTALLITVIITKALISTPSLYVKHSQSAGWLEVLISGLFEIVMLAVVLKLADSYKGCDILDIAESCFGKVIMRILGVLSAIIFVLSTAVIFRSMAEMVRNTVMRGISYETVMAFLLIAGIVAARMGLKTQINVTGLIFPVILITVAVILVINYSRLSFTNIQPYLGTGFSNIINNALLKNASYFEIGLILFFIPFLRSDKDVKIISFTSLSVSILVISVITLLYQLSVPYKAAETFALPLYQMTRMLRAGTFFQRIEPLNLFLWGGAMFIYVGLGIYMTAYTFKRSFDLYDYKPLTISSGIIIALVSLIPGSETTVEKIFDFLMTYGYFIYPIAPLIILIVAKMIKSSNRGV
ncbi:MAG: endospore germination permease [Clostridia bacterium]|nr:endospore germination permease [Clostridia bacterium]